MDANTIKSQYPGYAGWNDPAAIVADFKATGGAGKGGSTSPTSINETSTSTNAPLTAQSAVEIAKSLRDFNIESAKPAIQTLETGRQPLKERYTSLLKSIKEKGAYETGRADVLSAQELGRRGISTESTYAGEFQQEKRLPVQTAFSQLESETGLQGEQAQQSISNAIAQLQSGAGGDAISSAMSLLGAQQTAAEKAKTSPVTLSEGQTLYDPSTGKPIYTAPKSSSESTLDPITAALIGNIFGNKITPTTSSETKPTYSANPGSTSKGGNWYFTGSDWIQVVD